MHSIETVECLHCVLVSRRYRDNHKVRFQCSFLHIKSGETGTTARQSRRAWDVEQTPNFRKQATRSSDANRQGHLCNSTVPPPVPINSHLPRSLSPSTLARTLAPLLALDDAGDEALRCHNLSDAVFTPTADIVLSAVAVGVLRRQVRARKSELLDLISHSV